MTCSCQILASCPAIINMSYTAKFKFLRGRLESNINWQPKAMEDDSSSFASSFDSDSLKDKKTSAFCIIEGPETLQDFASLDLKEIREKIHNRRNRIFLYMEELRRLRIQQRIKKYELGIAEDDRENELSMFPSSIPFLPPLNEANLTTYYILCFSFIVGIIFFGGLVAPTLGLKLGFLGNSYGDFIRRLRLPLQLSHVDPIVASFSGGAVGVITALMVVEINNVKEHASKRCKYCLGTGYLACAQCSTVRLVKEHARCSNCSGSGKVMCTACLCTGMVMASEHDPRIDPFD